jgi:hypothetical protein
MSDHSGAEVSNIVSDILNGSGIIERINGALKDRAVQFVFGSFDEEIALAFLELILE